VELPVELVVVLTSTHETWPVKGWAKPGGQGAQRVEPIVAVYVLLGHATHCTEPDAGANVPGGQNGHSVRFAAELERPAGQRVHDELDAQNDPAGHVVPLKQLAWPEFWFVAHARHALSPELGAYENGAHDWQAACPTSALNEPGAHRVQLEMELTQPPAYGWKVPTGQTVGAADPGGQKVPGPQGKHSACPARSL
jgi:hypothetical protein